MSDYQAWRFDVESGVEGRPCNSYADALRDLHGRLDAELDSLVESAESDSEAKADVADFEAASAIIESELAEVTNWRDGGRAEPIGGRFELNFQGRLYWIEKESNQCGQ